ncbi:MAG: DUF4129 domain-containing protein, partial [Anaerolineae bacterium]
MDHYISHRYYKLIRLFVTGMGASVILPWLILSGRGWGNSTLPLPSFSGSPLRLASFTSVPSLILFALIWLMLLFFVFLFEWVNKWLNDDDQDQLIWRTVMVILIVLILFPLNRLLLYSPATAPMFTPARGIINALFNFTDGPRPENTLIVFYVVSWLFAIWVTSNVLGYTEIGRGFQVGIVLNILAISWLSTADVSYFLLFLPFAVCSLAALALSQIDTKIGMGYHSQGGRFSLPMWAQLSSAVGGFALLALLVANAILPSQIKSFLALFNPIWQVLWAVILWILRLLGTIVRPVFIWIFNFFERLISLIDPFSAVRESENTDQQLGDFTELPTFRELIATPNFRYIFIGLMLILGLFIIWIVLNRTILKRYREETEDHVDEEAPEGFDLFGNGAARLRSWLNSFRGNQQKPLLVPERIEDMYANMCRLAGRRGFPRAVSQPPDQYLVDLFQAFPGQNDQLAQLTGGYMRSHYGEIALPAAEMQQ